MPRVPNTRPTYIYWLIDVRPEILAKWSNGYPFYCGKTVMRPEKRLVAHRASSRLHPTKLLSERLTLCGDYIRIQIMEIVPCSGSWVDREKFWIYSLRLLWEGCVNIASGGQGAPGFIHTAEARAKIAEASKRREITDEHRRKLSEALKGRLISPEWRENIRRSRLGKSLTEETRRKLSIAGQGRIVSEETRRLLSERMRGRTITPDWRDKLRKANLGKTISEETRIKMSAAKLGKRHSVEARRKMSEASKGKPKSPEHVENWKRSMEHHFESRRSKDA